MLVVIKLVVVCSLVNMTMTIESIGPHSKDSRTRSILVSIWNPFGLFRHRSTPKMAMESNAISLDDDDLTPENVTTVTVADTQLVELPNGSKAFRIIDEISVQPSIAPNATVVPIATVTVLPMGSIENVTRPHSRRKPPDRSTTINRPIDCEKLTVEQLYRKLERVGGRNQRFMAADPDEAGRNFVGLYRDFEEFNVDDEESPSAKFYADTPTVGADPLICNERCGEIRHLLNEALISRPHLAYARDQHRLDEHRPLSDTGPAEVQEGGSNKTPDTWKSVCHLEKFVPIGNCTQRGDEEVWGYGKLCSACHGVYMLSRDCFPSFFNSIICNKDDLKCIFDRFTNTAHGRCQARTLSFKVLRNKGTEECDDWIFEHLDVPIACECFLSKTSWLKT